MVVLAMKTALPVSHWLVKAIRYELLVRMREQQIQLFVCQLAQPTPIVLRALTDVSVAFVLHHPTMLAMVKPTMILAILTKT